MRSEKAAPILPRASVDRVVVRINIPHKQPIGDCYEQQPSGSWRPTKYHWIDLPNGKVGLISYGADQDIFINFNPSRHRYGHNLNPFDDDLQGAIVETIAAVWKSLPDTFSEVEDLTFAYRRLELSAIDLCCDWNFRNARTLKMVQNIIDRNWHWPYNRGFNLEGFDGSGYLNQKRWDFLHYNKAKQLRETRPGWPERVHLLAKNRLRLEVKLRRGELKEFGPRMQAPGRALRYNFGVTNTWHARTYDLVLDFYLARIRLKGNSASPPGVVPLYRMLADHGAVPAWPRRQTYIRPTPYLDGTWQSHLAPRHLRYRLGDS